MRDINAKLKPNPFAGDTGQADPALAAALATEDTAERLEAVVQQVAKSRVLVPVLAHAHPGRTEDGGVATHEPGNQDACKQAAMIAVEAPDGRAAMPIFSSADAMRAWRPEARPVPVHTQNAAIASVAEADGLLVLDPGSERPLLLGRPAVAALATGESWVAPWRDEELPTLISRALAGIDGLIGLRIVPGRRAETGIILAVPESLGRESVGEALAEAQARLANVPEMRTRIDSVELAPARVSNTTP